MIARASHLGIVAVLALCAGCGGKDNPAGANGGAALTDCPDPANGAMTEQNVVFQGDRYVYVPIPQGTDPRAHTLFAKIWEIVRVQPTIQCWQAQGGTNNLQFFENPAFGPGPRYRFVGITDTEVGAMLVHSVGCYTNARDESYRAAVVTTFTGDLELLVVTTAGFIDHFIGFQGNFPLITRYDATADNCL